MTDYDSRADECIDDRPVYGPNTEQEQREEDMILEHEEIRMQHIADLHYDGDVEAARAAEEQHFAEMDAEHELERRHGGRTRCPNCDEFEVEHTVVNREQDPTDLATCRRCRHYEIFGDLYDEDGKFVRTLIGGM